MTGPSPERIAVRKEASSSLVDVSLANFSLFNPVRLHIPSHIFRAKPRNMSGVDIDKPFLLHSPCSDTFPATKAITVRYRWVHQLLSPSLLLARSRPNRRYIHGTSDSLDDEEGRQCQVGYEGEAASCVGKVFACSRAHVMLASEEYPERLWRRTSALNTHE